MPVDRNYFPHIGCIFIHIPKTGGTSVAAVLAEVDETLRQAGAAPKFGVPSDPLANKHMKGTELRALDPHAWAVAFKFCVVRNPFEQIVSSYEWWLQRAVDFRKLAYIAQVIRRMGGFERFVNRPLGNEFLNEARGNPEDWFLDADGEDLVDFILQAERMEELFDRLAERGIPIPPGRTMPRLNESKHDHHSTYYTGNARERVAERFRYVIERFGYAFEEG